MLTGDDKEKVTKSLQKENKKQKNDFVEKMNCFLQGLFAIRILYRLYKNVVIRKNFCEVHMVIKRERYLNKLVAKKENGFVKVITGIRRCGKFFLLFELYHAYLNSIGVSDENIIELALDEVINARYRNPFELDQYIREQTADKSKKYYIFIDEIQKVSEIQIHM